VPPEASKDRAFLITIDTEGDNLWAQPKAITTNNSESIGRFQQLCESYGFKPTYLTNYEMVNEPRFRESAQDAMGRSTAEIGMHLHAWNSPPLIPQTADDYRYQPYLIEYPEEVMRQKVEFLTKLMEDKFQVAMTSHRAGRWGFDDRYARMLMENGYLVDCSVTPHVSWRNHPGDPDQSGGPDFRRFPEAPYLLDPEDVARPGSSRLLEVPVTIIRKRRAWADWLPEEGRRSLLQRGLNRIWPLVLWLKPNGRNLASMLEVIKIAVAQDRDYVEFALHSSEMMPGGSPTFPEPRDIERLYSHLEELFGLASQFFVGMTLTDFYRRTVGQEPAAAGRAQ